jgi:hypothetical protein
MSSKLSMTHDCSVRGGEIVRLHWEEIWEVGLKSGVEVMMHDDEG